MKRLLLNLLRYEEIVIILWIQVHGKYLIYRKNVKQIEFGFEDSLHIKINNSKNMCSVFQYWRLCKSKVQVLILMQK